MVEVLVQDEGGGILAAERARIFDPFFTTKERGLGLGLAICHQVMEQHRGVIQIDSVEEHGTTVTCFLPITR
jgi:two-component system nitrogen regulation sensor histidine kinase GlnL